MDEKKLASVVIPALDGLNIQESEKILKQIKSMVYACKIHDLWDRQGPGVVSYLKMVSSAKIWVDLKLHDIPQTVKNRALGVKEAGGDIVTVMATGGIEMMEAAVSTGLEVYAVTVLTSLSEENCQRIYACNTKEAVYKFAVLAKKAGVHGIVCSPLEVGILAGDDRFQDIKFITPGVRSPGTDQHDQKRVDSHRAALESGAAHLVVGREITTAPDPRAALEHIWSQIR